MDMVYENNITVTHPQVAAEWSEKNAPEKPEYYGPWSKKKVWWKCEKGHEWQSSISVRTQGSGCPYCIGHLVIRGVTDLATCRPDLAAQWSEKNGELKPENVKFRSSKMVWWKCEKGHEWRTRISQRTTEMTGCPYCENRKVLPGFNDLATIHPELAKEWSEKNGDMKPDQFSSGSSIAVWWKCKEGHEWRKTICARTGGNGCPYCAGAKVWQGFNDLASLSPELTAQWSEKNELSPSEVNIKSSKYFWWRCEKGHEWQASPYSRYQNNSNCPYCGNKRVLAGFNDFATIHPDMVDEWSDRNGDLKPTDVVANAARIVWWKCKEGHEWQAPVYRRVNRNRCPICRNRLQEKKKDWVTLFPELVKEWSSSNMIQPADVKLNSMKAVWWKCSTCGYEWYSSIRKRIADSECPKCKERKRVQTRMQDARKRYALSKLQENLPQEILKYFVRKACVRMEENNLTLTAFPLQYYFPDQKGIIELSSASNWTDIGRKRENYKNQYCQANGLKMIRILDQGEPEYGNCICIMRKDDSIESFAEGVRTAFKMMGIEVKVDADRVLEEMFEKYMEEW